MNPPPNELSRRLLSPVRPTQVLLAEDDCDMRTMLAEVLRKVGLRVVEACHGTELLELLERVLIHGDLEGMPDLIVADVWMPGFTGVEVLQGLRLVDSSTPVILMTAFVDERTYAAARRYGAVAVLSKPFDVEMFQSLVQSVLRVRPMPHIG